MSNEKNESKTAAATTKEKLMEFTPFGAAVGDKIKLSIDIVQNVIAVPTKTGKTCSSRDAMRFMMLCQAQRLNPFAGDAYLVGYDAKVPGTDKYEPKFSLITAHVAFMKRAESHADYEGMESGIILVVDKGRGEEIVEREGDFSLKEENVVGGWARVHRKGKHPTYKRLSIEQRIPTYDTPFWKGVKAHEQIVKCAEADALRSAFPTLLAGLRTEGEVVNIEATVTPSDPELRQLAATHGALPEQERPQQADVTPQQQLEGLVVGAGFTFAQFIQWGKESGNVSDPTSITQFSEVKTEEAKRLVRADKGLLAALAKLEPVKS